MGMSDPVRGRRPRRSLDQRLRYAAAGLAYVVAALHLFHPKFGISRLAVRLSETPELLVYDPRPVAFVLSGTAIVVGVTVVLFEFPKKPLYALGMVLMVIYIAGYFAWHLTGHGGFLPGREALLHGHQPHEAVIAHLTGDRWAATAIVAEIALLGVLAVLYSRDR